MTKKEKQKLIARRLKQARVSAGFSQKELGKLIRMSDKTISAYEQARALPPIPILHAISLKTNQPLEFFTGDSQEREMAIQLKLTAIEKELKSIKEILNKNGLLE